MFRNAMFSTELIFKLFKFFHTTKIPEAKLLSRDMFWDHLVLKVTPKNPISPFNCRLRRPVEKDLMLPILLPLLQNCGEILYNWKLPNARCIL